MLILQIIISFIVGGLFIAFQTIFGERVPLRWRGVALTIPTTLALGLFFIGLTKSPADIPQAVTIIPAGFGLDYVFVLAFAYFSRFGLARGFFLSFIIWAGSVTLLLYFPPLTVTSSILFYAAPLVIIMYALVCRLPQVTQLTPVPLNGKHVAIRSFIGGSIIATIIILSKTLGNVWGGLFTTFPAAFTATFLIYYLVHGKRVIPSVAKSFFFPGAIGFTIYTIVAAYTLPHLGIWIGTLMSYLITIPFYILFVLVKTRFQTMKGKTI